MIPTGKNRWNGPTRLLNLAGTSIFGQRWTEEVKEKIYSSRIDTTTKLVEGSKKQNNPLML